MTAGASSEYLELSRKYEMLYAENLRLRRLLSESGISFDDAVERPAQCEITAAPVASLTKRSAPEARIALFLSLFRGREDVYARQWRGKDGKIGYSPACKNEWVGGLCGKPKAKCASCANAAYLPYDERAAAKHLSGESVLGVYPLRPDDTCAFLAIDFDEASWKTDIRAMSETCDKQQIPYAVEISRSGNGAHFWLFFEEFIDASSARNFGSRLLTMCMRENARLKFSSYDRMFPNQDTMPKGGFGNLIALPFQKAAFKNGGSVFVNESFEPYADQWTFLSSVRRVGRVQLEAFDRLLDVPPLGELQPVMDESGNAPWKPAKGATLTPDDMPPLLNCAIADRLYIPIQGLSQRAHNRIKRLAAFRNPQFYQAQAMRMPVWNKPRVICLADYADAYLCLPRGCRDALESLISESGACIRWEDARSDGKAIDALFTGALRGEQVQAFEALASCDDGVLSAATAFGKTVIGAALIDRKRVNTLILVHRKQLMSQWKERLTEFLDIRESLPEEPKRRGGRRKREIIGVFGGGKDTRGGLIDIAILQSMGGAGDVKPWIGEYGMVIVDECHHVPAVSFEQVLKQVRAKFVYGLTATPTRQDGHHPILNMYLGQIRYRVDAKAQAEKRPFTHVMIPRFTGARFDIDTAAPLISQYYSQLTYDDMRNHMIVDDVMACVKEGRNCLLLSERTRHVYALAELLAKHTDGVHTLTGGGSSAESAKRLAALRAAPLDKPLIVCATGKYIGEGFDEARLDTLFLTLPISWHGTLAQYAGRLHRLNEGKREVRVYDYVDGNADMLERMYHKRLRGYAALGYSVSPDACDTAVNSDIIYDQHTFQSHFINDIDRARLSVVIVSPYVSIKRVRWLESGLRAASQRGVVATVYTRPPGALSARNRQAIENAAGLLRALGVNVQFREAIHQKYCVIDDRVVWYGSINLLSFGAAQESIMRLVSGSVAMALNIN